MCVLLASQRGTGTAGKEEHLDPTLADARRKAAEKRKRAAEEELQRIRDELAGDTNGAAAAGAAEEELSDEQWEHRDQLRRRAESAEQQSGAERPVCTIRAVFRTKRPLSLLAFFLF